MRIGIALKVSLGVLGVVLALGSALGAFFAFEQGQAIRRELDRRIELTGAQLAATIGHAREVGDAAAVDGLLVGLTLDREIAYVIVKGADGEVVAARWERGTRSAVTEYAFPLRAVHAEAARFGAVAGAAPGAVLGSVAIGVDLAVVHAAQRRIALRTAVAVLVCAALAALLGVVGVHALFARDLGGLLAGMRDVGAGDLSRRVRMGGRDQLARIGAAFDEMAERLSTTLVSQQELETTVARRTAQLQAALASAERSRTALSEREEQLRLLLDSTAEAIYGLDLTGACTFCNPACLRHLGYSAAADLLGRNMHDLVHHSRRDGTNAPVEECGIFRTLRTGEGHHAGEDVLWRADGTALEVEWWSWPVFRRGVQVGAVVTFLDVTERKKLEGELLNMRKLESVALLAGGIAHDFNNLLTGVLGNVSLARESLPEGEPRTLLEEAEAATLRTKALTRQLLTFSKGGAPVKKAIALPEVVHDAARFALSGSAVAAEYSFPADPWPVEADAGQIGQVIQNLAINAVQAMPGGGRLALSVENVTLDEGRGLPLAPGRYVKVSVADSGVGIPAEHLPRIFDPYFSTKREGSGLGLATVYSIVRNHGGHVAAASAPGRGTTFDVYLPASARPAIEVASGPAAPARGGGRVLLMDDDATVRNVGRSMLARLGYEVITAADGREAIDAYQAARREGRAVDVVIVDLTVPGGMGGAEAFRALRAIDPDVRALVTSGYSNDPVLSRYRENGFAGVVAKPYTVSELAAAVSQVMAKASAA